MISVVAADGAIRERLPDETLLVFVSDTHIGGSSGSDIFDSAAELTMLLEDLHHHEGPVELVLAGDFFDLLRMADVGGADPLAATLARPEFRELFATLRAFAGADGRRVVYPVGNHDAELWWNSRIRGTLQEALLVVAYAAYGALAVVLGRAGGGLQVLGSVLGKVTYGLVVLVFALVVVFLVGRRTTEHAVATLGSRFPRGR
jgi:hypothetical protein